MPVLTNIRHERFARAIVEGQGPREAAVTAGYNSTSAASTAWRLKLYPRIQQRVEELRSEQSGTLLDQVQQCAEAIRIVDRNGVHIGWYLPIESLHAAALTA